MPFLHPLPSIRSSVLLLGERRVRFDFLKIMKDQINRKPYSFVPWQLKDVVLAILSWFIGTLTLSILIIKLTDPDESVAIIITLITSSLMLMFLSIGLGPMLYRSHFQTFSKMLAQ